jgi:hypothetical protein
MLLHIFLCDDWFCLNLKKNSKSLDNGFQKEFKFSLTSFPSLSLAQLACSLTLPAGSRAHHLGPAQQRPKPQRALPFALAR